MRQTAERTPPTLPYKPHDYQKRVDGRGFARVEGCAVCPLPASNRVHDEEAVARYREEIAEYERRRFGD